MSRIDEITGELRNLLAGVERAQGQAGAADHQAQEVARRAAAAGFAAIAAGMARVQAAMSEIRGGLGNLAGVIGEVTQAAAAVPHQASPQETIAGLAPVLGRVDAVRETAVGVISRVGEAQQLVTAVLQGGQPGPLLSTLDGIKQVVVQLAQRSDAVRQTIDAAVAEAGQLGASGN